MSSCSALADAQSERWKQTIDTDTDADNNKHFARECSSSATAPVGVEMLDIPLRMRSAFSKHARLLEAA